MSYEVDVIEIKTKKVAFKHSHEELRFINHYSPSEFIHASDDSYLTGPAAVQEITHDVQSRRALHIRNNTKKDKYIIWSPEFEEFVGQELSWIEGLQDDKRNLEQSNGELKTSQEFWQGVACRYEDRLEKMRIDAHKIFLFGMVSLYSSAGIALYALLG